MIDMGRDRIRCSIRHIQTAFDVDPWAREIAMEAMEKQNAKIIPIRNGDEFATCPNCGHDLMYHREGFCERCGQKYEMLLQEDGGVSDAEKLKNEYPHNTDWDYPVNTNSYVCESIDNASTVIEAEGE